MIHPHFCPAQVRAPLIHPAARAFPSRHGPALCVPIPALPRRVRFAFHLCS